MIRTVSLIKVSDTFSGLTVNEKGAVRLLLLFIYMIIWEVTQIFSEFKKKLSNHLNLLLYSGHTKRRTK